MWFRTGWMEYEIDEEQSMDAYMIPTANFHRSEYVGEYFKCREYMTSYQLL